MTFTPAYLTLFRSGELKNRIAEANSHLHNCDLCAWECKIDRHSGELGVCQTGTKAKVSSYNPHHGEEILLRGWRGSGTIFFTRCNLHCQYCQNYDISQSDSGKEVTPEELAKIMIELQHRGCHNINFVSPSHVIAQILPAIEIAAQGGLHIPLVYNTGGYDSMHALQMLEGIIDIYMPDMKYSSNQFAQKYSKVRNYAQKNQAAVKEMHRQVGDLLLDEHGIAQRGLLVRHLILPNGRSCTQEVVAFLAKEISINTYLNLMNQYRPTYHADQFPEINRPISHLEYQYAIDIANKFGMKRLDNNW